MIITLFKTKILKVHPQLSSVARCYSRKAAFEWMVNEKENIPTDLYAKYIRQCFQQDTYNVPIQLMEQAFQGIPRKQLMTRKERKLFKNLPEEITIYRGTDKSECTPRLSWSLDASVAQKHTRGRIYKATIPKDIIIAYFCDNTYEEEIVVSLKENYEIIDD